MHKHKTTSTDCLSSIAERYGFRWETIWGEAQNTELRQRRPNPNTLKLNDVVHVPDTEKKHASCATDKKHLFRRVSGTKLLLRLLRSEQPIANASYRLEVEGAVRNGRTTGKGILEEAIPAGATRAVLTLLATEDELTLELGALDPIDELTGIQGRLDNLGFDCRQTGELDAATRSAVRLFQETHELPSTGEPDVRTKNKLKEVYGC